MQTLSHGFQSDGGHFHLLNKTAVGTPGEFYLKAFARRYVVATAPWRHSRGTFYTLQPVITTYKKAYMLLL